MTDRISFLKDFQRPVPLAASVCLLVFLLPLFPQQALAQAVPADAWPTGGTSPVEQPLAGQQLGTDLTLNQTVDATNAEHEAFNRYALGAQLESGAQTNFFGTETDQQTAIYISFTADAALNLRTPRTRYYALYEPRYNIYPQYTSVNNYGQTFFQNLSHSIEQHVWLYWDTTASRYLSLDQYLPQTLGIGGIGIVVPNLQAQLLQNSFEITNAATSLRLRYLMSTRMTLTASLTGAFFLAAPTSKTTISGLIAQRYVTSGADVKLDYQMSPRDTIGTEVTPIYIYGLSPTGHLLAETVQATYKRQLTSMTSITAAAGPLFFQASIPAFGSLRDTSYALNGSLRRRIRQSQLTVSYSRAFVVSFLSPAIVAQQGILNAYIPLHRRWVLTGAASYTHDGGGGQSGGSANEVSYRGTFYGGSAQVAYLLGSKRELYGIYSRFSEDFAYGQPQPYSFSQNKFGAGIRFNLGNATNR